MRFCFLDSIFCNSIPQMDRFKTEDCVDALCTFSYSRDGSLAETLVTQRTSNGEQYRFSLGKHAVDADRLFENLKFRTAYDRFGLIEKRLMSDILLDAFRYVLLFHSGLLAHGSVVVYQDKAIMFSGLSGAGKSTQANLWKSMGAWVLNYDKPAILFKEQGVHIAGTPWSGKEHCYVNAELPLACIVFVKQYPGNKVVKLSPVQAYSQLYPNYMLYPIDQRVADQYEKAIESLSQMVPVYELYCTDTLEAVNCLMKALNLKQNDEKEMRLFMRANENFVLKNIAGESILIPRGKAALDYNATILLNETGTFLWNQITSNGNCSVDQLVGAMLREYQVSYDQAKADVLAFVEELKEACVIDE